MKILSVPFSVAVLGVGLGATVTAPAQVVPLVCAAAEDAHVVVHGITSPNPDPGMAAFERIVSRLLASKVHEDFLDLATLDMRPGRAARVRAQFQRAIDLLDEVEWAEIMRREVVFTERFALPVPEYVLVCRVAAERATEHLAGLRRMFEGFADMIGDRTQVRSVDAATGTMIALDLAGTPMQFVAGISDDALVLSTSGQAADAALQRLHSGGQGSLQRSERYQASLRLVPASTEGTAFVDVAGLVAFFDQALQAIAGATRAERAQGPLRFCRALLRELAVVDHVLVSTASDGTTVTETTLVRLRADSQSSPLLRASARQRPWSDWHSYVPAEATGFYFDAGMDVGELTDWLTGLAVDSFGGSERATWAGSPEFVALRRAIGHVSGESAMVTFPSAGTDGCALGEAVLMLRLASTEGVSEWLRLQLDAFAAHARRRDQQVVVTTSNGLHRVEIEALSWIRPVIGVHDGMVVVATSPAAFDQVQRVRRGEAPDIRSSERFAALGLGGSGHYLDYQRVDAPLRPLHCLLGTVGFALAMLPADRETRAAIEIGTILTKVSAALREGDVSCDTGTDLLPAPAPDAALMRRVTRYRE